MEFGRAFTLVLAIQIFGFMKHRTVLRKDCTEQNGIQNGKNWKLSHLTECVIEYRENNPL